MPLFKQQEVHFLKSPHVKIKAQIFFLTKNNHIFYFSEPKKILKRKLLIHFHFAVKML